MGFQGSYYPLLDVNTSRIFAPLPWTSVRINREPPSNENNIPRIMGSLALAPYSGLSWAICLALD
jgi:hypothetical protein